MRDTWTSRLLFHPLCPGCFSRYPRTPDQSHSQAMTNQSSPLLIPAKTVSWTPWYQIYSVQPDDSPVAGHLPMNLVSPSTIRR